MESTGETFNLTVKTLGNISLPIKISGDATIWDFKLEIQRALEGLGNDEEILAQGNQRIIFRGRLLNNEMIIKNVANLQQNGDVMHVVRSGGAMVAGENMNGRNLEELAREELVNAKIRSLRCLLRNGEECIKFAQQDRNSENRERFPEEGNLNVGMVSIKDFGEIAEQFGGALVKWSTQLSRMSNMLSKDPAILINQRNAMLPTSRYSYEECEHIIKNNMDVGRYLSTASQQFSEFFIPLDHPPRRVSTLAARRADPN